MADPTASIWTSIGYVTSGFSLLAFVVAAAVTIYKVKMDNFTRILESTDEKNKIEVMDRLLETFSIPTDNLTKEQKFILLMELLKMKRHNSNMKIFAFCFISLVFGGVAYASITQGKKDGSVVIRQANDTSPPPNSKKTEPAKQVSFSETPAITQPTSQPKPFVGIDDLLLIPLTAKRSDVESSEKGDWKSMTDDNISSVNAGDSIYVTTQSLFDNEFRAEAKFIGEKVNSIALTLSEESKKVDIDFANLQRHEDSTANEENVNDACFGDQYHKIKHDLSIRFGQPIEKKENNDLSDKVKFYTQFCVTLDPDTIGPRCIKSKNEEVRTSFFKKNGYKIVLTARKTNTKIYDHDEYGHFGTYLGNLCEWKVDYRK